MKQISKRVMVLLAVALLLCILTVIFAACNGKDAPQSGGNNGTVPGEEGTTPGGEGTPPSTHEHVYTPVAAKSPTCTEDGNVQYYTCTCGKYFDNNKNEILLAATVLPANGHDKVTSSWESDTTSHWHKCNNCNERLDLASHQMSDWIIDGGCNKDGTPASRHKECADCDYKEIEENYVVPHTWKDRLTEDKQKECEKCGYKEKVYEERDGKIYFGEYPQTKVEDDGSGLIATLSQMSGDRPVKGDRGNWISYDYFIDWDTSEYMWYIDLEYIGVKYRGVYFTSYRPHSPQLNGSADNAYQDDNGYYLNTLYWFKWEPIEWRILEKTDGEAFLMSNVILDSQQYYFYRSKSGELTRTIDGKTVYENNYKYSDIRTWLNGTFFDWAFDEFEQTIVNETLVDNSVSTTVSGADGINSYVCENTNDKVFLLSYTEIFNTKYGFNSQQGILDTAKQLKATDYAKSQGEDEGKGRWWLRSPSEEDKGRFVLSCDEGRGTIYTIAYVTQRGVVPAIKIEL